MAKKLSDLKFVQTINNIWKIEDLRARIGITLALIAIYRFGSYVVLPGIDAASLDRVASTADGSNGLMSLLDMFSGGAFTNASIFALGIMPYISASIVIQLLSMAVPAFQKMQREGESGRRKINQYTRYLTVFILLIQGPSYLLSLPYTIGAGVAPGINPTLFTISSTIILAAGSMFILWLGERITDKGIGNGVSIIIMIGIIARLPQALYQEFYSRVAEAAGGGIVMLLIEVVFFLVVICAAIALLQGTRRIPVQYAKQAAGGATYSGARQYIPLKVNAANVMPIIFAQAIMFVPMVFANFGGMENSTTITLLMDPTSWLYNLVSALLIIAFTYFYTAITINPVQMAEDMKRNNGFIPGVKPGKPTAEYIDTIMSRLTLPGSLFLAAIAILPAFAGVIFGIQGEFAQFFGGTSLLILVGVVLDTLQQVESYLLMRHYDGLLNSGRIKGRIG
ncbi:MAG: preprotein translocase subunit SecY [Bacteroidaceae bacterium]|nr:preprotein translocase subunit SecY [Bacteroidaceae bacterium]